MSSFGVHRLQLTTLVPEEVLPQIQLKFAGVNLKPTCAKITPLSAKRDVLPEGRQIYQLILTYNLHLNKQSELALNVPHLSHLLYESEFESQLWMVFDSNKAVLASGDSYSVKNPVKLAKGDYTIRLQVRHEKRDLLEKITDINMVALFKMSTVVTMDIHEHYTYTLVGGGPKLMPQQMHPSQPKVYFIATLPTEKLSKLNLPANTGWLTGLISYSREEFTKRIEQRRFTYVLSPGELPKSGGRNGGNDLANKAINGIDLNGISSSKLTSTISVDTTPKKDEEDTVNETVDLPSPSPPNVPSNAGDGIIDIGKKTLDSNDYQEYLRDFKCSMMLKLGMYLMKNSSSSL